MGVLTSQLFTDADPVTVQKLEDCAIGSPNEVFSHFAINKNNTGEHVRRVQQALLAVKQMRPELGIPDFQLNGVYDRTFANAIFVYKQKKDIRNYANKIDDIIGIKTIRSLDSDSKSRPVVPPSPKPVKPHVFPRQLPNCVPDAECPVSENFDVRLLMGTAGGEGIDLAEFIFEIRDTSNGLSAIYKYRGFGLGVGSPVSFSGGGTPSSITTSPHPVRVTRFGPMALIGGGTSPPLIPTPVFLSKTLLTVSFRPDGMRGAPRTPIFPIDTGPITIPGGDLHTGPFSIVSHCKGQAGAGKDNRILPVE